MNLGDIDLIANCKIIILGGPQLMPLAKDPLDLFDDLRHLLRGFRREESGSDGSLKLGAHDFPLGGRERDEDRIVLIGPPRVIPLGLERANNPKGHVLDPD